MHKIHFLMYFYMHLAMLRVDTEQHVCMIRCLAYEKKKKKDMSVRSMGHVPAQCPRADTVSNPR